MKKKKKKKILLITIPSLFIILVGLFLLCNKNIVNKIKGDLTNEAYEQAGFGNKIIYKCAIDEYNDVTREDKTVDDVLTDEELSEIGFINCLIPEENKNDIIDLKGYEKLNSWMFRIGNEINELNMNNFIISDGGNRDSSIERSINSNTIINKFNIENNNANIKLRLRNINMINTLNIKNNIFTNGSIVNLDSNPSVVDNAYIENNRGITSLTLYGGTDGQNLSVSNNPDLESVTISRFKNTANIDLTNSINLKELKLTGNNLETLDLSNNVNLAPRAGRLYLSGNNLIEVKLPEITIKDVRLQDNKLKRIDIPNNMIITGSLDLSNNEFEEIDLSNSNINSLNLSNNKLKTINLPDDTNIRSLNLDNNELKSIDLSNNTNLTYIHINNNKFGDNFKYLARGRKVNIKDIINLPGDTTYNFHDTILEIDNHVLNPRSEGVTSFSVVNEILANNLDFDVNIYDITSNEYKIDKDKKEIVYENNFDVNKIKVTDGYTLNVDGDNLIINYGEDHADTFKLVKDVPKITKKITTTKKGSASKESSKKSSVSKNTNVYVKNNDIYLNTNNVSTTYLKKVKGYNRNIIVEKEEVTFKINGLDIKSASNDINLDYILVDLDEYGNKKEIKKDVNTGYILKFKKYEEVPLKVLVELPYSKIKEKLDKDNIKVYTVNNGKYNLVINNKNMINNKLSFYINKLDTYLITNESVQSKKVGKEDIYNDNVKFYIKRYNDKQIDNNHVLLNIIIPSSALLLILIIVLLVIINKKKIKEGDNI